MSETAQELRDQAAELLRRSVALDRAAAGTDPMREFTKNLFAPDPEDDAAENFLAPRNSSKGEN